jgi:hypothetical protein
MARRIYHNELAAFLVKLLKAFPTRTALILKQKHGERIVQIKYPQEILNKISLDFARHNRFLKSESASSLLKIGLNQLLSFRPNVSHQIMVTLSSDCHFVIQILTMDVSFEEGIQAIISSPAFYIGEELVFDIDKATKSGSMNKTQAEMVKRLFAKRIE